MKYISYSVWGDNKVYTYGIIENVLDAKKYYEGWVVRVHYNDTVPTNIIDWLKKQDNVEVIHHPGTKQRLQIHFGDLKTCLSKMPRSYPGMQIQDLQIGKLDW